MRQKIAELIPIKEAMDNLAAIVSINMDSPPPIGVIDNKRIITEAQELEPTEIRWFSEEGAELLLQVLDMTYRSVYQHLQSLYQNPGMDWKTQKTKEGVSAMMALVGESVKKMESYLSYRLDQPELAKIRDRESFKVLQEFYSDKFAKKFVGGIEGKQAWEDAWAKKPNFVDAAGTNLKDFDALLEDKQYELFFIANEQGEPYLNEELLRNLKLTADFDMDLHEFEEDPFLKVRAIEDRDLQAAASQILNLCSSEIEQFYKIARKVFQYSFAKVLSQSIFALFLAANPRHLLQRTTAKHSLQYFQDFHQFLRRALKSPEYQKWIAYPPPKSDKDANLLIDLANKLSFAFFHRASGVKQEAIGLIHRTMRRGAELQPKDILSKKETIWNQLLLEDEQLRTLLHKFPSGPLLRTLDAIRKDEEENLLIPFDPWIQGNLPSRLYTFKAKKKEISVLRFGTPTKQSTIQKAEVIDELRAFLRSLSDTKEKHLIINLQDRLSWTESARSLTIEHLADNPAFSKSLIVITLPKNTDFYYQLEDQNRADLFMESFKEKLRHPEENGFYFPSEWKTSEIMSFADTAFASIHKFVFEGKNTLSRQNRQDFIEIFYQMLVARAVERFGVDSLSFNCKDAIDTGAFASGLFYGFLRLLQGDLTTKEHLDTLRFLFYWPALSIRERSSDPEGFHRGLSMLESFHRAMEEEGSKLIKSFNISLQI